MQPLMERNGQLNVQNFLWEEERRRHPSSHKKFQVIEYKILSALIEETPA